jgi:hypothetical protein
MNPSPFSESCSPFNFWGLYRRNAIPGALL